MLTATVSFFAAAAEAGAWDTGACVATAAEAGAEEAVEGTTVCVHPATVANSMAQTTT